jgi:FHA domain
MAKLIITEDGRDKIYEIVDEVFTIGASDDADLQLREDAASELHLEVRKTPQGFRLMDLETKNGTRVNGHAVNQHVLANGDTIEIGETRITYIGRGPAKRAAGSRGKGKGGGRKTNLESTSRSHYRRQGAGSGISSAGMMGIAAAVLGIVGLVVWMLLNSAGVEAPEDYLNLKNARVNLQEEPNDDTEKEAKRVLATYKSKYRGLSSDEQDQYKRLEQALKAHQKTVDRVASTQGSQEAWARIKNHRKFKPTDHQGLIELCEAFLGKFAPTVNHYAEVQANLKRAKEKLASITPEDRELAKIEGQVHELVFGVKSRMNRETGEMVTYKRFREAYDIVQAASGAVRAVRGDELEKLARKLKGLSRQSVTTRKNELRHAIRENDMAKANRMLDQMFDSLIHETIEAYLERPDGGYANPENARLELETQKLLRERLARYK